jgi:hypothetical protein
MRERSTNSRERYREGRAGERLSIQTRIHERSGPTADKPHIVTFVADGHIASENRERTTISPGAGTYRRLANRRAPPLVRFPSVFATAGMEAWLGKKDGLDRSRPPREQLGYFKREAAPHYKCSLLLSWNFPAVW